MTTARMYNHTTAMVEPEAANKSVAVGLIAAFIAVLFFGSNFIPVKKFEPSDGLYFQLILCCGIWITGLVFTCAYTVADGAFVMYSFHPWAMLGGVLWATGNIMCVPCIKLIGLSIGLLVWGTSSMLWGWAQGRFGLFGLKREVPANSILNYIGVAVAVVALALYTLIKPNNEEPVDQEDEANRMVSHVSENDFLGVAGGAEPRMIGHKPYTQRATQDGQKLKEPLIDDDVPDGEALLREDARKNWLDRQSNMCKRIIGVSMALVSGLLYGSTFIPVQYQIDHGSDGENAHYIFSHFCGIFIASILYFILYCCIMCGEPNINPKVTIPAFISGIMWAIAQSSWFIANKNLSQVVSYPLVTGGPGLVAAFWGVVLFKEIQGTRNFVMLGIAFFGTVASSVLVALSSIKGLF